MASALKIWLKIESKNNRTDIKFNDLKKMLLACGYVLQSQDSSHFSFKNPSDPDILTIVCKNSTACPKAIYIKKSYERIIQYSLHEKLS